MFYRFKTARVKELKFCIDVVTFMTLFVCLVFFFFPEVCLHRALWENGASAQAGSVAHLHWCQCWNHRTQPSPCPHAALHPSKWVFSHSHTYLALDSPEAEGSAQSWATWRQSIQAILVFGEDKAYSFLPALSSCQRFSLQRSCVFKV